MNHQYDTYVERILALGITHPEHIAIRESGRQLTTLDLRRLVLDLARALDATGLRGGERVAIVPAARAETLAVRYAAGLLGCPVVVCPNTGVPGRLARLVARAQADTVVVFPQTAAAAREIAAAPDAPRIVSVGEVPGVLDLATIEGGSPAQFAVGRAHPDALAVLVATGGTTGEAKLSARSYRAWEHVIDAGPMPDRRLLVCTSFAYVAQVLADQVLLGGGTLVLRDGFEPQEVLRTIAGERITHLALVEPLLVELIDDPAFEHHDLSSLVAISHIGADAAPSLRRRLLQRAGEILAHPYGASEAGVVTVLAGPDYSLSRPDRLGTAGVPLPGVEVCIERADGSEAPRGEEGLIAVRSPQVAEGYDLEGRVGGFIGDRYRTGDVGMLDVDGYLHVRGRAVDQRVVGGRLVMPVDVQDALCDHPDVRYAVAIADDHGGFSAAVVLRPESTVTAAELAAHVADHHGEHLMPHAIVAVDRVPVTEQGKPDRARIATLLNGQISIAL
jgi:fatty-acyl-CoA synthase